MNISKQREFNFDVSREKIRRQIRSVTPVRIVYGETARNYLEEQVKSKERQLKIIEEGVTGAIDTVEDAQLVAQVFASLKYGVQNAVFSDLGVGLYTAYTTDPNVFWEEPQTSYFFDPETEERKPDRTIFTVSWEGVYKLLFGPLVNDRGIAVAGAGPVVNELKKKVKPALLGVEAEPLAMASVNLPTNEKISFIGKPITLVAYNNSAVRISVDHTFYPLALTDDQHKARTKFLHAPAGLTAVLALGARLRRNRAKGSPGDLEPTPQVQVARRLILTAQAAYEMDAFAPGITTKNRKGRFNIILRRHVIGDLFPETAKPSLKGKFRYGAAIRKTGAIGDMYQRAIDELGILHDLDDRTIILANRSAAEFPETDVDPHQNAIFIKGDRVGDLKKQLPG